MERVAAEVLMRGRWPTPPARSHFIAFLPFLSGLFGFDSGQMVKLHEPDREFY